MALFALWHEKACRDDPAEVHRRLLGEAHVVPEVVTALPLGDWHLAAFATATAFYTAAQQVWHDEAGGACVIHGVLWRVKRGAARLLDATAVAALLVEPGATLPADVCGEYAVLRVHPCGTATAFSDAAGLHQIFWRPGQVANRAGLLAALGQDWTADAGAAAWITAIGYRAQARSGWRGIAQVDQGMALTLTGEGSKRLPMPQPTDALAGPRGFSPDLLEQGLDQAVAAIRLAAVGDAVPLPITGGKDSRAVLAIALRAGLRDRLDLFTRGYEGHPDVIAGCGIAEALGLRHRREAPLGSDIPALWTVAEFRRRIAILAYQTDGGMGGWDLVSGTTTGRETLVTGHMGEVLKAYAKRPLPPGPFDPVAMVRLQGPFDPLGIVRPETRDTMVAWLADGAEGLDPAEAGDLFYYRNRIPNWLGGIRGVKSFERQPIMPLGVPALMRLAFAMTPEERKRETAHHALIRAAAPELLPPPFAMQGWHPALGAPAADPIQPAPGAPPVFGNWQYSINRNPAIRAFLTDFFAGAEIELWDHVDRAAVLDRLRHRSFDYFDGISLLGLTVSVFHATGLVEPVKLGGRGSAPPRPIRSWTGADTRPRVTGHVDAVEGRTVAGWAHAPDWPGAQPTIEAWTAGRAIGRAFAEQNRPDLAAAGIGDGRHGFTLTLDEVAVPLTLTAFEGEATLAGAPLEAAA